MVKVLLVGAQLEMTRAQLDQMRERIEGVLPGRTVVVVPGMAGGPFEAEVREPVAAFVDVVSNQVASLW